MNSIESDLISVIIPCHNQAMLSPVDPVSRGANEVVSKPLVSIIIIFLNEERFLSEAIESVLGQTYNNWELWLVDDGSTDGSTSIARRYAERYATKFHYLDHEGHQNLGMSESRNLGILHAKGEYVAFLDADDVWLAHKLEQQVRLMLSQPEAAMVYGSPQLWHSWEAAPSNISRDSSQPIGIKPDTLIRPPTLLALFLGKKAITPAPSDVLLRREIIDRVNRFENSFRGLYEDQAFFTKVSFHAPVFVSGQCWCRHRQHEGSACSVGKKTGEYRSGYPAFLNWSEQYLYEKGAKNTEVWRVLQKQLWPYRHPILYHSFARAQRFGRRLEELGKRIGRQTLPGPAYRWLRARRHSLQ
jgi:glycosyltransferase involved in cell wall biosynthesis